MSASTLQSQVIVVAVTATAVVIAATYYYFYYGRKRVVIPQHWMLIGKVTNICIFPLKSGRRLEVKNAECTTYGLRATDINEFQLRDRSFVIYDESNCEFKTARTYPKLVLLETSAHDKEHVVFDAPNQRPLYVKVPTDTTNNVRITLHAKEKVNGLDCGDEAASWFSRFIMDKPNGVRLAYHDGEFKRKIASVQNNELQAFSKLGNEDMGMFSDLASYLLINQSSIDNLNMNLEEPVTANNFRPNIIVEGDDIVPFSEEDWDWIKIGSAIFRNVKPCTRCVMTTVNPETGLRSTTRQPLKCLERLNILKDPLHIQAAGKSPVMGINMGLKAYGNIASGDQVYISKTDQ